MLMEKFNLYLNEESIIFIITFTIYLSNCINNYFKITNCYAKQLIVILISLIMFFSIVYKDNTIVSVITTYIIILFSSTGVYDFTKKNIKFFFNNKDA